MGPTLGEGSWCCTLQRKMPRKNTALYAYNDPTTINNIKYCLIFLYTVCMIVQVKAFCSPYSHF